VCCGVCLRACGVPLLSRVRVFIYLTIVLQLTGDFCGEETMILGSRAARGRRRPRVRLCHSGRLARGSDYTSWTRGDLSARCYKRPLMILSVRMSYGV